MLLNQKQACGYLGIMKLENFRDLVKNGEIGFKIVGKSKFYPKEELDRWQSELTYTDYTNEAKRGGRISLSRQKTDIHDIDVLATLPIKSKLNYFASNSSRKQPTTQKGSSQLARLLEYSLKPTFTTTHALKNPEEK